MEIKYVDSIDTNFAFPKEKSILLLGTILQYEERYPYWIKKVLDFLEGLHFDGVVYLWGSEASQRVRNPKGLLYAIENVKCIVFWIDDFQSLSKTASETFFYFGRMSNTARSIFYGRAKENFQRYVYDSLYIMCEKNENPVIYTDLSELLLYAQRAVLKEEE